VEGAPELQALDHLLGQSGVWGQRPSQPSLVPDAALVGPPAASALGQRPQGHRSGADPGRGDAGAACAVLHTLSCLNAGD